MEFILRWVRGHQYLTNVLVLVAYDKFLLTRCWHKQCSATLRRLCNTPVLQSDFILDSKQIVLVRKMWKKSCASSEVHLHSSLNTVNCHLNIICCYRFATELFPWDNLRCFCRVFFLNSFTSNLEILLDLTLAWGSINAIYCRQGFSNWKTRTRIGSKLDIFSLMGFDLSARCYRKF